MRAGGALGYRLGTGTETVRMLSVDSILEHFELDEVDYVKMDVEGTERDVLREGGRWPGRVRSIKVEVHEPATVDEVAADLTRLGFSCERDDEHWACVVGRRDAAET